MEEEMEERGKRRGLAYITLRKAEEKGREKE